MTPRGGEAIAENLTALRSGKRTDRNIGSPRTTCKSTVTPMDQPTFSRFICSSSLVYGTASWKSAILLRGF